MRAFDAHVRNGRIVVDAPTDLPEGTKLKLQVVEAPEALDDEAREALHENLRAGLEFPRSKSSSKSSRWLKRTRRGRVVHMVDRPVANAPPASTSVETNGWTFVWGTPARWKAQWRDESLRRHLALPMEQRLLNALALVLRRSNRDQRST